MSDFETYLLWIAAALIIAFALRATLRPEPLKLAFKPEPGF